MIHFQGLTFNEIKIVILESVYILLKLPSYESSQFQRFKRFIH